MTRKWEDARQYLIHHLPRSVLNNSSNLVGSIQLVAEMLMFKSSNNDLISPGNHGKPLHYLIDPPRNILKASFTKSKFRGELKDIFKPSFLPNVIRDLNDIVGAAARDRAGDTVKLSNYWSARSGLMGITSMTLSTVLPERGESPEETMQMVDMAHEHPFKYAGLRLYQSLNPFEVWKNKRPLVGLGMTLTGIFSVLSGFRQVEGDFKPHPLTGMNMEKSQLYRRNYWQMAGGFITMLAGGQLFLGVNNEQGWRRFGTTQLTRFLTLPGSIGDRFKMNPETGRREQGATWYFGAQTVMAVKNTIASLIGGVEIKEDGTLVDHAAMRKEAVAIDRAERADHKAGKHANGDAHKPHTKANVISHERIQPVAPVKQTAA